MKIRRRFASGPRSWFRLPGLGRLRAMPKRLTTGIRMLPESQWLIMTIAFAGAAVIGYLIAALVIFPAPIFAENRIVPNVLQASADLARAALTERGFRPVDLDRITHPLIPAGRVVWQDPPPEVLAAEGTEVRLTVSSGPQRVPIPDVAGYDADNARTLLESAGLQVGPPEATHAPIPRNVAVGTRPAAGNTVPPGARITLVVSLGAATIRVPHLIGRTLDEARSLLGNAGLVLGDYFYRTDETVPAGTVIDQMPASGTLSAPGTRVQLRLARQGTQ